MEGITDKEQRSAALWTTSSNSRCSWSFSRCIEMSSNIILSNSHRKTKVSLCTLLCILFDNIYESANDRIHLLTWSATKSTSAGIDFLAAE